MRALLTIAALLLLSGASAPAVDLKPSMREQVRLGQQAADQIRDEFTIVPADDPRARLLQEVADRLLATLPASERAERPWRYSFELIEDDTVNAFALPGGPVFVFTGLWDLFETEDQLAAVLGHEIAHVRKEHWARDYARSLEANLVIGLLGAIFRVNDDLMQVVGLGEALAMGLPRSRRFEIEADDIGYEMMVAAGFHPGGMVDIFRKLQQRGGQMPEFISTHPDDKRRVLRIEERIARETRTFREQVPITVRSPEIGRARALGTVRELRLERGAARGSLAVRWEPSPVPGVRYQVEWYADARLRERLGRETTENPWAEIRNLPARRDVWVRVRIVQDDVKGAWTKPVRGRAG